VTITANDIDKELIDINTYYENEKDENLKSLLEDSIEKSKNE
jgi:hypothetical protein